jgi:hypothetical protein
MHLADLAVFPGQRGVHMPAIATHDGAAQGFTLAAVYDPETIDVLSAVPENSSLEGIQPELLAVEISPDPAEPYVTVGILFDMLAPFDGRTLPPGKNRRILNIIFDVHADARPGTTTHVELRNQVGHPPKDNIFTVNGFSVLPTLTSGGRVRIAHLPFPPPKFFLRGDVDSDGRINVTDAVRILNFLFEGGSEPACYDAADVSDDGVINLSDAIFLLLFLFRASGYPAPPFPDMGMDPTEDDLPLCLLE